MVRDHHASRPVVSRHRIVLFLLLSNVVDKKQFSERSRISMFGPRSLNKVCSCPACSGELEPKENLQESFFRHSVS
jgi:hypothetical protein